jgi:hypothetical protein
MSTTLPYSPGPGSATNFASPRVRSLQEKNKSSKQAAEQNKQSSNLNSTAASKQTTTNNNHVNIHELLDEISEHQKLESRSSRSPSPNNNFLQLRQERDSLAEKLQQQQQQILQLQASYKVVSLHFLVSIFLLLYFEELF